MRAIRAFTLIEILVVVTIIVALLAILLPSMGRALDATQRTVCASNVRQWSLAVLDYASDNFGVVPETYARFGGRYPAFITVNETSDKRYLSHAKLQSYLPGVDRDEERVADTWVCPSSTYKRNALIDRNWSYGWIDSTYAYFAGVSQWTSFASDPDSITDRRPEGGRVLIAETLYRWGSSGAWDYSHGPNGSSAVLQLTGGDRVETGVPTFSGINRAMGDMSVARKPRDEFDPDAMAAVDWSEPLVRGGGVDSTFY